MGSPVLSSTRRASRLFAAKRRRAGFTLIEILVVVAIIAILAALLFPAIGNALKSGKQAASINNLRQWGVAFAASVGDHDGEMPSDGSGGAALTDVNAWYNRLPPEIKITALKDAGSDFPKLGSKSIWINQAAPTIAVTGVPFCYGFNDYLSTTAEPNMRLTRVTYPSRTALMVEKEPTISPAGNPTNIRGYYGTKDFTDPDAIANILFVDGHVAGVTNKVFSQPKAAAAADDIELAAAPFLWIPYSGAGM